MNGMKQTAAVKFESVWAEYRTRLGVSRALEDISFEVMPGELFAIVGESGSGKSTVANAIGRMLPRVCHLTQGTVTVLGKDIAALAAPDIRALRKESMGFIPQDPIASLNPTMRVKRQLELVLRELDKPSTAVELIALLESVKILEPERVLRLFPHELSGGMAQRVAIAMAMAREPRILIADEPTASLDAQVRDEILTLLVEMVQRSGASLIWISHDLGAVRRWCERVMVMQLGKIVEMGPTEQVLGRPSAAYTRALVAAIPQVQAAERQQAGTNTEAPQESENDA